jgi:hypothetical protein
MSRRNDTASSSSSRKHHQSWHQDRSEVPMDEVKHSYEEWPNKRFNLHMNQALLLDDLPISQVEMNESHRVLNHDDLTNLMSYKRRSGEFKTVCVQTMIHSH